jgi:hypothetical protein
MLPENNALDGTQHSSHFLELRVSYL